VSGEPNKELNKKDIFIIHGRDDGIKETVARFLEHLDLHPIILHEQANRGNTIIEKFEQYSNIGYAIAILTPDDIGGLKETPSSQFKDRARQNVVFELGFFFGKLKDRMLLYCMWKESNCLRISMAFSIFF
jgi:predicted nucleotide-binding protein